MLPGVTSDLQARRICLIHKRLAAAQNSDRLSNREWKNISALHDPRSTRNLSLLVIPQVLCDADRLIRSWGESGTIDPFTRIPEARFFSGWHGQPSSVE